MYTGNFENHFLNIITDRGEKYFIIKSEKDLKIPFIGFLAMMYYSAEAGEDFLEYNENLASGWPFTMWMLGKGYINSETAEKIEDAYLHTTRLLTMYDVLSGDFLFPELEKAEGAEEELTAYRKCAIAAEYLSSTIVFRKDFYKGLTGGEMYESGFYQDTDGIYLSCKIEAGQLKRTREDMDAFKDEVREHGFRAESGITLRDIYNLSCFVTKEKCSRLQSID